MMREKFSIWYWTWLFSEHLAENAPQEVNINDTVRTKIIKQINSPTRFVDRIRFDASFHCHWKYFSEMFLEAEKHIYELMKKNSYPRFIQSEYYRNLLQNAPNPMPKRRFVSNSFIVGGKVWTFENNQQCRRTIDHLWIDGFTRRSFIERVFFEFKWKEKRRFNFSGILHFVKDTYFRTSSSSSDDEYDSDESGHRGDHGPTNNAISKVQPLGAPLATTAAVATAVVAANSASLQSSIMDGNK